MHGYVANTDFDWYTHLRAQDRLDEVNFWQPSGGRAFRVVERGAPFFFRLKSPQNAICGFGWFVRHSVAPAWLAWDSFGEANGAPSFDEMRRRIERYRRAERDPAGNYAVGCLMIARPVFFAPDDWVRQPAGWARNIVQGKSFDLRSGEGDRILNECLERAAGRLEDGEADGERFGDPLAVRPRLGQGMFRIAVLDAYGGSCAVTTEHSLPVLEAAHIQPYASGGEHDVANGLVLRADLHRLFDLGYLTIRPDHRVEVSRRLRDEWENGRVYYDLAGREIALPSDVGERPDPGLLAWHNEQVFLPSF